MATIATSKFDAANAAYGAALGYQQIASGPVTTELAHIWGAPAMAGARSVVLAPASGAPVFTRLVERAPASADAPACGWFATEICVEDADALYRRLDEGSGFAPFAPPVALAMSDKIYPMQCRGLSGEILYLNEVRGSLPDVDLPIAQSFVDHMFIAVLGASDLEKSIAFYSRLLGADVRERHTLPYKTINRVFDLPLDTLHDLAVLGENRDAALEIDQSPATARRASVSDQLPEGLAMVSFTIAGEFPALDTYLSDARKIETTPYGGAQARVAIGPDGERTELIICR